MPFSFSILNLHRPLGPSLARRGWGLMLCGALALAPVGLAQAQTTAPAESENKGPLDDNMLALFGLDKSYNAAAGANELRDAFEMFQKQQFKDALDKLEAGSKAANAAKKALPRGEILLARLWFATQRPDIGRQLLEIEAAKDDKDGNAQVDHDELMMLMGELALADGRLTDAAMYFDGLSAKWVKAGADAGSAINKRNLRRVYQGLTTVQERRGNWDKAKYNAEKWLANADDADEKALAQIRLAQATYNGITSSSDATKEIEAATKLLVDAYTAEKAKNAAAKDRRQDNPYVTLGMLASQKASADPKGKEGSDYAKFHPAAKAFFEKALTDDPDDARVYAAYAMWLLSDNMVTEAHKQATTAQQKDPENDAVKRLNGVIALRNGEYQEAAKIFRAMQQNRVDDLFASNYLALALAAEDGKEGEPIKEQLEKAQGLAEVNARANQRNAEVIGTLAYVYYRQGRINEAAQLLQAIVQGGAQVNSDMAYYLALVMADANPPQLDRAKQLLDQAVGAPGQFVFRSRAETWRKTLGGKSGTPATPTAATTSGATSGATPPASGGTGVTTPPKPGTGTRGTGT